MSDDQGQDQWKQKYYQQLDLLEQKEQDWEQLENILKRTIGRLSLAAEGQHAGLDRHIRELRSSIKNQINHSHLESIVEDISRILSQLEEKQGGPEREAIQPLEQLLQQLPLNAGLDKARKKLLKKFHKSTDQQLSPLLVETTELLKSALATEQDAGTASTPGLLDRLFNSDKGHSDKGNSSGPSENPLSAFIPLIQQLLRLLPWPDTLRDQSLSIIDQLPACQNQQRFGQQLQQLQSLIKQWPTSEAPAPSSDTQADELSLQSYRNCLLELLDKLDNNDSPSGTLSALRVSALQAQQQQELSRLAHQLSQILLQQQSEQPVSAAPSAPRTVTEYTAPTVHDDLQPSIQELLIRLLEQLIVPADLQNETEAMKHRLEQDTEPADWKVLLKDVAQLINSIRSRMQKEKHEFENFLQQVTDRLKTMDQFLQTETSSLQQAESQGNDFDQNIHQNMDTIRQDVNQATELSSLKQTVNSRLDTIADHIKHYRELEQHRIQQSRQKITDMHGRMKELEKESRTLKQLVIEKNKQAMFDTLTGIPNRLSYEKKVEEEISRFKRFKNPLSLAIWDIDFFKKVNDTYGHKAGDKVLKTVAQLLNKRIRSTDFLARYGGEEFVMLLPGTQQEECLRLVNDLRQQVENCGFHYHGEAVKITVSCGISSFCEGDRLSQVFDRADQALYKAKNNGRNQCVAAACLSD